MIYIKNVDLTENTLIKQDLKIFVCWLLQELANAPAKTSNYNYVYQVLFIEF